MAELPRVTSIIAAAGLMPDYERWDPNRKGIERGTAVDVGCRLLFEGHKLSDLEVDPVILPQLMSLDLWLKETGFKAKRIQHEGVHPGLNYIGHWDVDGAWGCYNWLIDTKDAAKAKWHKIQTSAYKAIHDELELDPAIERRGSLYLQKNGSMALLDPHFGSADFGVFHSALKLYQGEKALDVYRMNIKRWMEG